MVITRFAPAPTGLLHLGHVVNAIYVWGVARAAGGRVLLRIEDHDRQRSRPEYEQATREDLAWLGFEPDVDVGRQSDRDHVYAAALAHLRERGLVYACECSRAQIIAAAGAGNVSFADVGSGFSRSSADANGLSSESADAELRYPGTCRAKSLPEHPGLGLRIRLEPSVEQFDDLRLGHQEQRPSDQCGDLLARDRERNWTYQFAVTVDDMNQGVTLVVRGVDLLASTGRQIQLARLLGRPSPPSFLHHPLVMKSATQKLSKADRDTSVRDLRAAGVPADEVIGRAAHAAGLLESAAPIAAVSVADLVGCFTRRIA